MLFCLLFYNITKIHYILYCFITLLHLISSLSLTKSFFVPYAYVSIESIDFILLLLFEHKAILLTSLVKTLCLSLLELCWFFNIDLLFFYKFFMTFYVNWIFLCKIYFILKKEFSFHDTLLCVFHFFSLLPPSIK